MRSAVIHRQTTETDIQLELNLDGAGVSEVETRVGFLDHMLTLLGFHSGWDLRLAVRGDLHVDDHHLVEDVAITLGQALDTSLGARNDIARYGSVLMPMDEVLVAAAVDLGGRYAFVSDYAPRRERVGDLSTELVTHFFRSLAIEAKIVVHLQLLNPGENEHHRIEAFFKGFGRALREAARPADVAVSSISTKGPVHVRMQGPARKSR